MLYPIESRIYKIVNYNVEEYTIVRITQKGNYILRDNNSGREMNISASALEISSREFDNYSFSKIYLLNMLQGRLEMILRKITIDILQHKNDFNERAKKYENLKYVVSEEEQSSRDLANRAGTKYKLKNGKRTGLL